MSGKEKLINPYIGLKAYKKENSSIYYGYDEQRQLLLDLVNSNFISLLIGFSGTGKSSFINASFKKYIETKLNCLKFNLSDKNDNLQSNLLSTLGIKASFESYEFEEEVIQKYNSINTILNEKYKYINTILNERKKTVLIIDQFEELFTIEENIRQAQDFVDLLIYLHEIFKDDNLNNLRVLLSCRVDYLGQFAQYIGLAETLYSATLLLPKTPLDRVMEAVEFPASRFGCPISKDLLDVFRNNLDRLRNPKNSKDNEKYAEDDSLSLLQYYLFQMWEKFAVKTEEFTTEHYLKLGPFEKIIDRTCDDVYYFHSSRQVSKKGERFPDERQERHMTKFLFQFISKQDKFNSKKVVRSPKSVKEICQLYNSVYHSGLPKLFDHTTDDIPTTEEHWDRLIDKYDAEVSPEVAILRRVLENGETEKKVDVMHEAVFRQWFRCNRWIKEKIKLFDGFQSLIENENKYDYNEKILSFNELVDHWEFIQYYESQYWREEFFEYEVREGVKELNTDNKGSDTKYEPSVFFNEFINNEAFLYNEKFVYKEWLYREIVQRLYRQRYLWAIKRADFYTLLYINHYKEKVKKDWKFQLSYEELNLREFDKEFYFALNLDSDTGKELVKETASQTSDSSANEKFNENSKQQNKSSELGYESDYKSIVLRWIVESKNNSKKLHKKANTDPSESESHIRLYEYAAFGGNIQYLKALLAFVYLNNPNNLYSEEDKKSLADFLDREIGKNEWSIPDDLKLEDPGIIKIGVEISAFSRSLLGNQVAVANSIFDNLNDVSEKVKALLQRSPKYNRTIFHNIASNSEQLSKYLNKASSLRNEYVDSIIRPLKKELGDVTETLTFRQVLNDVLTNQNRENISKIVKRKISDDTVNEKKLIEYFSLYLDSFELEAPLERLKDKNEWLPIHTSALPTPNYSNNFSHLKETLLEADGEDGGNALFWACSLNNLEAVKELLRQDNGTVKEMLSIENPVDFFRKNYLYSLIRDNLKSIGPYIVINNLNYEILSYLLSEKNEYVQKQLDSHDCQGNGLTILHYYSGYSFDFAKALLQRGANANLFSDAHEPKISKLKRLSTRKYTPLDYAVIQGDLNIVKLYFSPYCVKEIDDITLRSAMVTAFELQSNEILEFLRIKGGTIEISLKNLSFYDSIKLGEIDLQFLRNGTIGTIQFLIDRENNIERLNGTSPPIHKINATLPINLNDDNVYEYLKFFCSFVHGEEGAFKIIDHETVNDICWLDESSKEKICQFIQIALKYCTKPSSIQKDKQSQEFWKCTSIVNYSNVLFLTHFKILKSGMIEMEDDFPIVEGLSLKLEVFENGLRTYKEKGPEKDEKLEFSASYLETCFWDSAINCDLEIMKWLIKADERININKTDGEGKTALRIALENKDTEMVTWLLTQEKIADIMAHDGKTAADIAQETGDNELFKSLKKINILNLFVFEQSEWEIAPIFDNQVWEIFDKSNFDKFRANDFYYYALSSWRYLLPKKLKYKGVRMTTLPFYPKTKIFEVKVQYKLGKNENVGYLTFMENIKVKGAKVPYMLNRTSLPIHKLNAQLPVQLNDDNVYKYLKFFCLAVHGEEGAFKIIDHETVNDICWLDESSKEKICQFIQIALKYCTKPSSIQKDKQSQEFWKCTSIVNYSNVLFLTHFKILKSGMIEMEDDFPIVEGLSLKLEVFENGLRTYKEKRPEKDEKLKYISFIDAAEEGLLEIMKWLIKQDKNLDINMVTEQPNDQKSNDNKVYGKTALRLAVENKDTEMVKWLLSLKIKDTMAEDNLTAKEFARVNNLTEIIAIFNKH